MVEIWLPYGSSEIPARVPEERLVDILTQEKTQSIPDPAAKIKLALESDKDLLEAATHARQVCLAVGACSNLQLSSTGAQCLVEFLTNHGVPPSSIAVLRTVDAPELDPATVGVPAILSHDALSSSTVATEHCKCSFPVSLNSIFASADLRVVLGELRPHHLLGYSGLCDAVFPGLASRDSKQSHLTNRNNLVVSDLHAERVGIASSFGNLFALGFVLNSDLSLAEIAVGTFQGCLEGLEKAVQAVCKRGIRRSADIVVMSAGGKPEDESLTRAVETVPAALAALKRDGVLIVAAECSLGYGNTEFYQWCAEHKDPRYLEMRLKRNFNYEGYKATLLLRTLEKHRLHLVSTIPDHYVENTFRMRPAVTVNSALQSVQRTLGSNSTISVIPNASRIIPDIARPTQGG